MKYIITKERNAKINLATEEYLFFNLLQDEYLMLWQNEDSIILGKFQNAYQEINIPEAINRKVNIVRRNSGGGCVFHDMGNLNFSYITDWDPDHPMDYDKFLQPVISALRNAGINAEKSKISDLTVDSFKISGNAQVIRGKRILHHGTILFQADLNKLGKLLVPTKAKIESKAVKSVRSPVMNVKEIATNRIDNIEELKDRIIQSFGIEKEEQIQLTGLQKKEIEKIVTDKYDTWEWNFGMSPTFTVNNSLQNDFVDLNVKLKIEKGIIVSCQLIGKGISPIQFKLISQCVENARYDYAEIKNSLTNLIKAIDLNGIDGEEMMQLLF